MADQSSNIIAEFKKLGVAEHDALILADCIVTHKSCSWINTDSVDEQMLTNLNNLIAKKNYRISVKVDNIPTRDKYIWDVKIL